MRINDEDTDLDESLRSEYQCDMGLPIGTSRDWHPR